jgi:dienelactone hydrolase
MVVLVHPEGRAGYLDANGEPKGLARKLLDKNLAVLLIDTFGTGESADEAALKKRDYSKEFFTTYNRTDVQERVQDIITACAFAQTHGKGRTHLALCGAGRAGLWAMLAAPACDALVADCAQFDSTSDQNLLARDIFSPGLRKLGGFEGVAAMNTGNPLLLHNVGDKFTTSYLKYVYKKMHVPELYRQETAALSDDQIAQWLADLKPR